MSVRLGVGCELGVMPWLHASESVDRLSNKHEVFSIPVGHCQLMCNRQFGYKWLVLPALYVWVISGMLGPRPMSVSTMSRHTRLMDPFRGSRASVKPGPIQRMLVGWIEVIALRPPIHLANLLPTPLVVMPATTLTRPKQSSAL